MSVTLKGTKDLEMAIKLLTVAVNDLIEAVEKNTKEFEAEGC